MDEQLAKSIKENKGVLRQLTTLNNQMKAMISLYRDVVIDNSMLEKRVRKLEQRNSYYPAEEEIRDIKIGGTD